MLFRHRQTGAGEAYCNGSSSERDKTMNITNGIYCLNGALASS